MLWCEEIFADKLIFLTWFSARSVTFCIDIEARTTSGIHSSYCFVDRHMPWILELNRGTLCLVPSGHHRIQLFEISQMLLLRRKLCLSFFIKIQLNTLRFASLHFTSLHFTSHIYCLCYTIRYMFRFISNHSQGDKSKGFCTTEQLN